MASADSTAAPERADHPSRRLIAAGIIRQRRVAVIEQLEYPPLPPAGTPARRRAIALRGW